MSFFDFLRPKSADNLAHAFIASYVSRHIGASQRDVITLESTVQLATIYGLTTLDEATHQFNEAPGIVQSAFMVNAMIKLGIHHGISGYRWDYIPDPYSLANCGDLTWRIAASILNKYGLSIQQCLDIDENFYDSNNPPTKAETFIHKGIKSFKRGDYDLAYDDFMLALRHDPSLPKPYYFLAAIYKIKNDYAQAIHYYSLAINHDANNFSLYIDRAVTYMETEHWQLADTDIDKSITINPNNWMAFYNKACIYSLTSRMSEALIYLKRSIELNSEAKSKAKMDKDFDSLRSDQRFQMLIQ